MNEITTRKQLEFFIKADYMMNRGFFKPSIIHRLTHMDYIMRYLKAMRKVNYYTHSGNGPLKRILRLYYTLRHKQLGLKLGFSIGADACGYGLVIPHWGTIVVGNSNRLGNYCVLHTSTCISDNPKHLGDGTYVSTGVKMTSALTLGHGVSIAANSVVNRSFEGNNLLIVGMPATIKRENYPIWYERDGEEYSNKVKKVEELKNKMGI